MEYLKSEGKLLTLEYCTAGSNIPAGTPVGLVSASSLVVTLGRSTTGFTTSALLGFHFLGILADTVSAGDSPVTVYTEGVFELIAAGAAESGDLAPGWPVWGDSGMLVIPGTGQTSDACIGTVVNRPAECTASAALHVRINPAIYRWMCWNGALYGATNLSATMAAPLAWPKHKGHA